MISVRIHADLSAMNAGLGRIMDQFSAMPDVRKEAFARRYGALTEAGAEWIEVEATDCAMCAVIGDDMRRLCAEFGITP